MVIPPFLLAKEFYIIVFVTGGRSHNVTDEFVFGNTARSLMRRSQRQPEPELSRDQYCKTFLALNGGFLNCYKIILQD